MRLSDAVNAIEVKIFVYISRFIDLGGKNMKDDIKAFIELDDGLFWAIALLMSDKIKKAKALLKIEMINMPEIMNDSMWAIAGYYE